MAREPINAGASTLAAMSDNIAKMGALRQQALAQTSESLNNAAKHLQEWQKGYDERKRAKWVQDMETAKFDEQKRMNDFNKDMSQKQLELSEKELEFKKSLWTAQAGKFWADASATNFGTQKARDDLNYIKQQEAKQAQLEAQKKAASDEKWNNAKGVVKGFFSAILPQTPKAANLNIGKPTNNFNTNGAMINNPENTNTTRVAQP